MKTILAAVFAILSIPLVTATAGESPRYLVSPRSTDRAPLPFSEGVVVGDTLYIAGHIGIDLKTDLAATDPKTETRLVMDAVEHTVTSAGMRMSDVASITVYCTDLALYDTFNAEYKSYFHEHYPARAFIGVAKLLRGAHFEVQGIAVRTSATK
jgi:2-iminobutanoate/2-iminopropanoate deaminase